MARVLAALVVGYALSPIDLIPDFIPVLGYLDDLVLVPLGVWLVLRLVQSQVMAESRIKAREAVAAGQPLSRAAAVVVALIWAASWHWWGCSSTVWYSRNDRGWRDPRGFHNI